MGLPVTSLLAGLRLRSGEPMLIQPPLFHGFGLGFLAAALTLGCPAILRRRCGPREALDLVQRHSATVLAGVPVLLHRMMALPAADRAACDTSSLRVIVSGAAPLRPDLAQAVMSEFGDILFDLYGTTEAGWATLATPADLQAARGTVGRPAHGVVVDVLDGNGSSVPPDRVGEIYVGSGLAFHGYSGGGSRRTVRNLMSTGDMGYLDRNGRLFVVGRVDDMIVSGGENVYPQEVEDLLAAHPAVADVGVRGCRRRVRRTASRPGRREGYRHREQLRRYVSDALGRHKVPRTSCSTVRSNAPVPARCAGLGGRSLADSVDPVDREPNGTAARRSVCARARIRDAGHPPGRNPTHGPVLSFTPIYATSTYAQDGVGGTREATSTAGPPTPPAPAWRNAWQRSRRQPWACLRERHGGRRHPAASRARTW